MSDRAAPTDWARARQALEDMYVELMASPIAWGGEYAFVADALDAGEALAVRVDEQAALVEAAVALVAAEVAEHAATDDMEAACRVEDQAMTYDEWRPARDRLNAAVAGLEAVRATRKVKQEGLLVEARAYAARQAGPGGDPADGGSGEGQGGE